MATPLLENIYSSRDKKFNSASIAKYHLTISINQYAITLCCVNSTMDECLFLEVYKCSDNRSSTQIQLLERIYKIQSFLKDNDWGSVILCIANQQYTLIPPHLFQEKNITDYAQLAFPFNNKDSIIQFTHKQLHITVISAIATTLLTWFQSMYQKANSQIVHQASNLIAMTTDYLSSNTHKDKAKAFVWLEDATYVHVIIFYKKKLTYYNKFDYSDNEACTHHILAAIATLSLAANMYSVIVAGTTTQDNLIYKNISKYIPDVSFKEKNPFLKQCSSFFNIKRAISMKYFGVTSAFIYREISVRRQ